MNDSSDNGTNIPIHDPLCVLSEWGDDEPPCVALTFDPNSWPDYPSCSFCWDKEDNCHCTCNVIAKVRTDERAACIAAVEATMHANGWDETTIACTVAPLRWVQSDVSESGRNLTHGAIPKPNLNNTEQHADGQWARDLYGGDDDAA